MRVSIPRPSVAAAIQSTDATAATCAKVLSSSGCDPAMMPAAAVAIASGSCPLKAAWSASEMRMACRRCAKAKNSSAIRPSPKLQRQRSSSGNKVESLRTMRKPSPWASAFIGKE